MVTDPYIFIDAHMVDHKNNDQVKHVQANQQIGMIGSSLEHQVLEQLFATDTNAKGFSAVKAIQLANQEGQKIFTVTKDNYQTIIPQLQLAPAAIADIRSAAMAELTVTTHQKRISVNGYTGEGYIILNDRGTGAYLINGGLYGGVLQLLVYGASILNIAVGGRNIVAKVLTVLSHIPILSGMANFLILSNLVLKGIDIFINCKNAGDVVPTFMLFSAIALGISTLIGAAIHPVAGYIFTGGAIFALRKAFDVEECVRRD